MDSMQGAQKYKFAKCSVSISSLLNRELREKQITHSLHENISNYRYARLFLVDLMIEDLYNCTLLILFITEFRE